MKARDLIVEPDFHHIRPTVIFNALSKSNTSHFCGVVGA